MAEQKQIKSFKDLLKIVSSDRIWSFSVEGLSTAKRRLVRFIKLMRIILNTFAENRVGFQCVALSYFCAIALIPMLAITFAVTDGLGLTDKVTVLLYSIIPNNPEMINVIVEKAGNIIQVAKSGAAGAISAVFFIWAVIWMMFQVERVFNNVWGMRKVPRKLFKRFSFYFLALILLPFIIVMFGFGIMMYSNFFTWLNIDFGEWKFIPKLLSWIIFYVLTVFTLTLMFKYIPATKVRLKPALTAAAVTAAVFVVFQYLYLQTQMFVTRLNAVYGAIAAVPLFLMWLNYSWQIVMYGAELSYGIQNIDNYDIPDDMTIGDFSRSLTREARFKRDSE